jgi:hypothetical protein
MKETKLGFLSIHSFNGKLLIAIEEKWKNYFEDDSKFEVTIKDGRYSLLGPKVNYNPSKDERTPIKENIHV